MRNKANWGERARKGFLASGIDPADRRGHKNEYIDLLQKIALDEVLKLKKDELVLDFGCGSGRFSYWIATRVKKVVGLEITPEMIDLAEKHRTSKNVEFILYDEVHFPALPDPFDLILSVGVLQSMKGELLRGTVSQLFRYLKNGGRFYLIEQVSDHPKMDRPNIGEYLKTFEASSLECLHHYPIRNGRWWLLYLIRYGLIPKRWFHRIAFWELRKSREKEGYISYYQDYLFWGRKK